jgi:hypothetical protein
MSEIKVDTLTGKTTANDITVTVGATATMSLEQGLAKAWVNFDGTGTIASRDSLNVSGLVDNGTGDYSITISSAMSNSNYAFIKSPATTGTGSYDSYPLTGILTTTTAQIAQCRNAGVNADLNQVCLSINGDLA